MRNLSDREIQNILKLKLNQPINPLNFRILSFRGSANGSYLTRLYNSNDLKNNYVRMIELNVAFYANTTFEREIAFDNKTFTINTNSRFSLLKVGTRLSPVFSEVSNINSKYDILIDNNSLNIFPKSYNIALENINLNLLTQTPITDGIDIKIYSSFMYSIEQNLTTSPTVVAQMTVELINDINPLQLEQTIKDN